LPFIAVTAASVGSSFTPAVHVGIHDAFFFFAAIVITAWYAGAGPGWLSVALSAFAVSSFFAPSIQSSEFDVESLAWTASFALCGAVTIVTSLRRRRTEETLRRTCDRLEAQIGARTRELLQLHERLNAETAKRIRTEAALRRTKSELARARRLFTLAEVSASIAHEVNQPLAAVVSNGEAARNWLRCSPPALSAAAESIQATVTAAVRAAEIVTRIRSLITRAIPRQASIEVNELVGEVLSLAKDSLTKHQVIPECRLRPALPPIIGDQIQLQEMLLNVISNALDAMAETSGRKRELVITTGMSDEDMISIVVSDSGHGLPATDPNKLFGPFYSTKKGGMGIGLSVCRTIAESHGGSIRAMTRQPHGAVLRIDLPTVGRHERG
jgi:C4-dicarboxylate-specific signal transduction histidine kinase